MKLLIDTDPGIDDAMAIIYAARDPRIELMGLTTVFGNVPVEIATRNALALVEHCGLQIAVAQGAGRPMSLPPFAPSAHVHGVDGFGALPPMQPQHRATAESAVDFMTRLARENPGALTVCAIGPITNVAQAILADAEFAQNVARIVFMGGALDAPGNITPYAEANTYHDPHALNVVLGSGAPVLMIGLDVTMQTQLRAADFAALAEAAPHDGGFLQGMAGHYLDFYRSIGQEGCALHDPMAVIACLDPQFFETERVAVSTVESGAAAGQTMRDAGGHMIEVALSCAAAAIKAQFSQTIARHQPPQTPL